MAGMKKDKPCPECVAAGVKDGSELFTGTGLAGHRAFKHGAKHEKGASKAVTSQAPAPSRKAAGADAAGDDLDSFIFG